MQMTSIADRVLRIGFALALGAILGAAPARAADKLLEETVGFTGTFIFLQANVPGAIIGVIRNGETVVKG
jgi:D-alanyl-D-alanine-carboxypeptidase/D-alanyl-D-alanine-endopeptidase